MDPERDDWPSVTFDDRCPMCPAGDGEPCEPWCECQSCRRRWENERTKLVELELADTW